jgi:hypothetical protein
MTKKQIELIAKGLRNSRPYRDITERELCERAKHNPTTIGSYFVCIAWEDAVYQMGTTLFNDWCGKRTGSMVKVSEFEDMAGLLRVSS